MTLEHSEKRKNYNYLYGEIQAVYHEYSVRQGLSDSVMTILYTLCSQGSGYPLGELCRRAGLSRQTVNSALRKLEAEGLIYLEAMDKKAKRICLTQQGKALAARTVLPLMEAENSIYCAWPEEDLNRYLELTERFLHDLKQKMEELPE